METIAEINDLACCCIESGDYQIALDALNICLSSVKQLKKCRMPASITDSKIGDGTRESIGTTLMAAKQKLFDQFRKYTKENKRKGTHFPTRSRKRQRRTSPSDQEFHTSSNRVSPAILQSEHYFVDSKPIRLTLFQWTQIAKNRCLENRETSSRQEECIQRHVELAISANIIFNIALSNHLLTISSGEVQIPRLSTDSGEDTNDDWHTNALQKKERLRGALHLYEIGFRVHTKRMALIKSSKIQARQRRLPDASSLPLLNTIPSATNFPSSTGRQVSPSIEELRLRRPERQIGRNDELKATTGFALALLNNCAHIHRVLGQHEKAKVFEKRLLSFLLVIIDGRESIHEIIGDDPAVDGYLKNAFDGTVFDRKAAPAAVA